MESVDVLERASGRLVSSADLLEDSRMGANSRADGHLWSQQARTYASLAYERLRNLLGEFPDDIEAPARLHSDSGFSPSVNAPVPLTAVVRSTVTTSGALLPGRKSAAWHLRVSYPGIRNVLAGAREALRAAEKGSD